MAKEASFDIVSRVDMAEVTNAVNQTMAEIRQRYDFKGSKAEATLDGKAAAITILADSEPQLTTVIDILQTKMIRRGVSIKALQYGSIEKAAGGAARQVVTLQQGIPAEKARAIVKLIKGVKLKVQASIQEDQVRVTGKKKDDLQAVIAMLKEQEFDFDVQFTNFR